MGFGRVRYVVPLIQRIPALGCLLENLNCVQKKNNLVTQVPVETGVTGTGILPVQGTVSVALHWPQMRMGDVQAYLLIPSQPMRACLQAS